MWFAIEPEGGDLFLIDAGSSSSSSADGEADAESSSDADAGTSTVREGLPTWVGADIPVIPAECAAAADAVSRAHVAKLLELCCSVKVRHRLSAHGLLTADGTQSCEQNTTEHAPCLLLDVLMD